MSTETPFHRRHLPHFYSPDGIYFITARLADSLPPSVVERAQEERRILESKESNGKKGSSGLPQYIDEMEWWEKVVYTIMLNHMHLVFGIGQYDLLERPNDARPLSGKQVSGIMMSMKRHTALEANRLLGRKGSFWQGESYDHVVRNTEELARIIEYVLDNPVKAGLVHKPEDWK